MTGSTIHTMAMMRLSLNALPKVEITSTQVHPAEQPGDDGGSRDHEHRVHLQREADDDQQDSEQRPVAHRARSKAAAARRLDNEAVARLHLRGVRCGQFLDRAVDPLDPVAAGQGIAPARQPLRRHAPPVREHVRAHRLKEAQVADHAVAALVRAIPAGTAPDREPLEPNRKPRLENLRVGQPAVGHVRLHGARPVMVGACS